MLTQKQKKFCDEYLIDFNGTQAAIRAGYSKKTANEQAAQNLAKLSISENIRKRQAELAKATSLSQEWVLNRFKEISDRCTQAIPVMQFNPVLKQMEQKTEANEDGEEVGLWTFDASGANKATEMIGKHLGFFEKDNAQSKPLVQITGMRIT